MTLRGGISLADENPLDLLQQIYSQIAAEMEGASTNDSSGPHRRRTDFSLDQIDELLAQKGAEACAIRQDV